MLPVWCLSASLADKPHTAVVGTFEIERDNGTPLVEVQFGDKATGLFAIDTGAYDCVMTAAFAKKLGNKQQDNSLYLQELLSGSPLVSPTTIQVPSLKIDGLEVTNLQFQVSPDSLEATFHGRPIDGLLGGTFLSRFALMMDYPRHTIIWIMPGDLEAQTVKSLGFDAAASLGLTQEMPRDHPGTINHYAVQAELAAAGKSRKETLWIDTGAPSTIISRETALQIGLVSTRTKAVGLVFSAPDLADVASVPSVKLGSLTFTDIPVVYPSHQGFFLPTLLGENVLGYGAVLFDFGPHRFYLKPELPGLTSEALAPEDARQIDWDRLRNAADLPDPTDILATGLRPELWEGASPKIARLRATMTGGPEDAAGYEQIGTLLRAGKEEAGAHAAFEQAVTRRRAASLADPNDATKMTAWVSSLLLAGDDDEAIGTAQNFLSRLSASAEACGTLGLAQETKATHLLLGPAFQIVPDIDDLSLYPPDGTLPQKPTDSVGKQIEGLRRAARGNWNRSVILAPQEPERYAQRASFWVIDRGLLALMHDLDVKGQTPAQEAVFAAALSDRQSQVQLSRNDPEILKRVALLDLALPISHDHSWIKDNLQGTGQPCVGSPLMTGKTAEVALVTLAQNSDKSVAAPALAALGAVQQAQDDPASEETWHRALADDPTQLEALRGLAGKLLKENRLADLRDLLTIQVAQNDTLPLHLLLAAVLNRMGASDDAETQVRAALKISPGNPFANLTLAGLLMVRSGYDYSVLTEVSTCLDKARDGFGTQATSEQKASLQTMQAVWLALTKDPTGARQQLIDLTREQPECTQAREALAALTLPAP